MLLENDDDRQAGEEVFLASYNSFEDFISGSLDASTFSSMNIASGYSIGGFAYHFSVDDPVDVPTSPSLLLTLLGLFAVLFFRDSSQTIGLVYN